MSENVEALLALIKAMQAGEPAPDTGLRERKKADKLARILCAARDLFRERGYDETTTRAISERAGIATGTLFSYFSDKRALLVFLFANDIQEAVDEAFRTLPDGPDASDASIVDRVMHLFTACFRWYERDLRLARSIIKEMLFLDPEPNRRLARSTADFMMRIAGEIAAAQSRGEIAAHVTPPAAAMVLFGQYYLALIGWVNGVVADADAALAMLRLSIQVIHDGLRPSGSEPDPPRSPASRRGTPS